MSIFALIQAINLSVWVLDETAAVEQSFGSLRDFKDAFGNCIVLYLVGCLLFGCAIESLKYAHNY